MLADCCIALSYICWLGTVLASGPFLTIEHPTRCRHVTVMRMTVLLTTNDVACHSVRDTNINSTAVCHVNNVLHDIVMWQWRGQPFLLQATQHVIQSVMHYTLILILLLYSGSQLYSSALSSLRLIRLWNSRRNCSRTLQHWCVLFVFFNVTRLKMLVAILLPNVCLHYCLIAFFP